MQLANELQVQLYTIHAVTVMITLQSVAVKLLVVAATQPLYLVCCCYCCCCCYCLQQCLVCRFEMVFFPLIKHKVEKFQFQVKQSVAYRKYTHSHTHVHLASYSYISQLYSQLCCVATVIQKSASCRKICTGFFVLPVLAPFPIALLFTPMITFNALSMVLSYIFMISLQIFTIAIAHCEDYPSGTAKMDISSIATSGQFYLQNIATQLHECVSFVCNLLCLCVLHVHIVLSVVLVQYGLQLCMCSTCVVATQYSLSTKLPTVLFCSIINYIPQIF